MRWCSASRAPGQRSRDLAGDPLERLQRQRLVRLVLQISDAPARVVVAHQAEKRDDRAVRAAPRDPAAPASAAARRDSSVERRTANLRDSGVGVTSVSIPAGLVSVRRQPRPWHAVPRSDRADRGRARGQARARWRRPRTAGRARAASGRSCPSASPAATADANVQPVPCVWRRRIARASRNSWNVVAVEQQVDDCVRRRRDRARDRR